MALLNLPGVFAKRFSLEECPLLMDSTYVRQKRFAKNGRFISAIRDRLQILSLIL